MVTRRRQRGYSLMEMTIAMAIFGIFLFIVVTLTAEMRRQEKKYPVNFIAHPDVNAVLARMRRDINDTKVYYTEYGGVPAAPPSVLWIDTITNAGTSEVVMWDFRTVGEVHRRVYTAETTQTSDWVARGVPLFTYIPYPGPHGSNGVEVQAFDLSGDKPKLAIDEIFIPRPHP